MAGNVAEWVQDVYRPIIDDEANDFNYFRGNVYTKNKIGDDGTVEMVTSDNIKYDTLSTGKVIARNFPGSIAQVPVDENETYLRTQFSTSDNKNYRDGDRQSTRFYKFGGSEEDGGDDADAGGDAGVPTKVASSSSSGGGGGGVGGGGGGGGGGGDDDDDE